MYDIVRRALNGCPELIAELHRRGLFLPDEAAELLEAIPESKQQQSSQPLGSVQFATLLANGDAQLAGCAVLRGILTPKELKWLYRLLELKASNGRREELTRTVERALEGREEKNGRIRHAGIPRAKRAR